MDFGDRFAYKDDGAQLGKSSEGEQDGQENLEEVEEDPTDKAAVGDSSSRYSKARFLLARARSATASAASGKKRFRMASGPLPQRQRPFLVFGAV